MTKEMQNLSLYTREGQRLYVNQNERQRFRETALAKPLECRVLCLILLYTGCRVSEALNLKRDHIQIDTCTLSFVTLKRRERQSVREIIVPSSVIDDIQKLLVKTKRDRVFSIHRRETAWKWIKCVMRDSGIEGKQATPKGLRHSFGVMATLASISPLVLQKWMGHASIETTQIYTQVIGDEERLLFERMW